MEISMLEITVVNIEAYHAETYFIPAQISYCELLVELLIISLR